MKTRKRIVSLLLVMVMLVSMSSVGFAEDTKKVNADTSKLSREKVESLYQQQGFQKQGQSWVISDSEKDTFFDALSTKQELELERNNVSKSNEYKIQAMDTEIASLDAAIEQLPVIEISYDEMAELISYDEKVELFSTKPSVPGDTAHTNFYGLTSYVTVSGTQYEVFQIVAYSSSTSSAYSNHLYTADRINLLSSNSYTLSDFTKDIAAVADFTLSLYHIKYALASAAFHQFDFSPHSTQSLVLDYAASQIFVYAYVTTSGGTWYNHLQTSESVTIHEVAIARETSYGLISGEVIRNENQELASQYYADVNRPATRYHNYDIMRENFRIGALEYSIEGGNPVSVNLPYFPELYTIPGI